MLFPYALIRALAQLNDNGLITNQGNHDSMKTLAQRSQELQQRDSGAQVHRAIVAAGSVVCVFMPLHVA